MNILVVQQTFGQHDGYCVYLNLYLIIMQVESLAIFIFGAIHIDHKFMKELFQHLSIIGIEKSSKLIRREIYVAFLWIATNYISGYIGITDGGFGATVHGINDTWAFLWYYSCITDFIKYISCFASICLIRLYFNTFPSKLEWIRKRLDVLRRNTYYPEANMPKKAINLDKKIEIAHISQYELEMMSDNGSDHLEPNEKNGQHEIRSNRSSVFRPNLNTSLQNDHLVIPLQASMRSNVGGTTGNTGYRSQHRRRKTYITKSEITHYEFKHEFQKILYLYRNLCSKLKFFVVTYLVLNSLCFIFVSITIIKLSSSSECNINSKYYVHYILELILYFLGWIAIIIPFAENHRLLRSFTRDVIATKVFNNQLDQILIQQYLQSCVEASPFSVGYINPTYSRIFIIFYAVFIIVGGQLISFYHVA